MSGSGFGNITGTGAPSTPPSNTGGNASTPPPPPAQPRGNPQTPEQDRNRIPKLIAFGFFGKKIYDYLDRKKILKPLRNLAIGAAIIGAGYYALGMLVEKKQQKEKQKIQEILGPIENDIKTIVTGLDSVAEASYQGYTIKKGNPREQIARTNDALTEYYEQALEEFKENHRELDGKVDLKLTTIDRSSRVDESGSPTKSFTLTVNEISGKDTIEVANYSITVDKNKQSTVKGNSYQPK